MQVNDLVQDNEGDLAVVTVAPGRDPVKGEFVKVRFDCTGRESDWLPSRLFTNLSERVRELDAEQVRESLELLRSYGDHMLTVEEEARFRGAVETVAARKLSTVDEQEEVVDAIPDYGMYSAEGNELVRRWVIAPTLEQMDKTGAGMNVRKR